MKIELKQISEKGARDLVYEFEFMGKKHRVGVDTREVHHKKVKEVIKLLAKNVLLPNIHFEMIDKE